MKKNLFAIFLALGISMTSSPIFAEQTAIDLLYGLTAAMKNIDGKEITSEEGIAMIFWTGYLAGFNEACAITKPFRSMPLYCMPDKGIQNEQIIRVVHKYLTEHPKDLHENPRSLILMALIDAFPCKGR